MPKSPEMKASSPAAGRSPSPTFGLDDDWNNLEQTMQDHWTKVMETLVSQNWMAFTAHALVLAGVIVTFTIIEPNTSLTLSR